MSPSGNTSTPRLPVRPAAPNTTGGSIETQSEEKRVRSSGRDLNEHSTRVILRILNDHSSQNDGPDTRERILASASMLFLEQGSHATGISTVLRDAGVHPGSLYHIFPNKEALLIGVLERHHRLLRPIVMEPVEAREDDPIERVFALLAWYRGNLELTGCRLGCPVGNLALEVSDTYPVVRPYIQACFDGGADSILSWLEEAGDRLPAGCDRRALSRFILTVMEGGLMQARSKDSLEPFDQSVAQLRAYFDELMRAAERERRAAGEDASRGASPQKENAS